MNEINIDTILTNGEIYTLQKEGDKVNTIGLDKGKIVFAGEHKDYLNYTADEIIDLNEKTVIPGMGDSHMHLYAYCQNKTSVMLDNAISIEDVIAIMKEKIFSTEKGKWIKGAGFDQTNFIENRLPTRWDLDRISTEHPVIIRRCCLHVAIANSLAIKIAGINQSAIGEANGLIEVDEAGEMTGIFREKAISIFDEIVPDPLEDVNLRKKIMLEVFDDMVSKGITSINTYAAKIWNYKEDIEVYKNLEKEGLLPIRVIVSLDYLFNNKDAGVSKQNPYDKVKYGSYKLFTDGSLGAKSAALIEPYSDDEGNYGILVNRNELTSDLKRAYELGLQPAIHAIGDKALEITLDAIEAVVNNNSRGSNEQKKGMLPIRIIHAQVVNSNLLERMKRLPIILDIQPIFLCTDLHWIESRLGKERIKSAYIWKTMQDAGLMLAGGSDCPVESYDPIMGIYAAVTRQDFNGFPCDGWEKKERLSVYEAICLFTKNIACTSGDEDVLGTIEKNKFADFVVLDTNPFTSEPLKLKDIKVLQTYVAGKKVYDREACSEAIND